MNTKKMTGALAGFLAALIVASVFLTPLAFAADTTANISWKLDPSSMNHVLDNGGNTEFRLTGNGNIVSFDGEPCFHFNHTQLYLEDIGNVLRTMDTFYVDFEVYFDTPITGTHVYNGVTYTPNEYTMGFFTWVVDNNYTRGMFMDGEGNLYRQRELNYAMGVKMETDRWYSVRFAISPAAGVIDLYLNQKKVYSGMCNPVGNVQKSRLRFGNAMYQYDAYMKNISVTSEQGTVLIYGVSEEESADFIGCQTTMPVNRKFDLRVLAGLDNAEYFNGAGYQILLFETDADGNTTEKKLEYSGKKVYQSILADGKTVSSSECGKETFSLYTVKELDASATSLIAVIRPFTVVNGERLYGKASTLSYTGKSENGYPVFLRQTGTGENTDLVASDDTFVQYSKSTQTFGSLDTMEVKNNSGKGNTRFVYIRFDISEDFAAMVEQSSKVFLKVTAKNVRSLSDDENKAGGLEVAVFRTGIDWDESSLAFCDIQKPGVADISRVGVFRLNGSVSAYLDVTSAVREALEENCDAVSFRLENTVEDGSNGSTVYFTKESEGGNAPILTVKENIGLNYELNLGKVLNYGYEPWGYTEKVIAEWINSEKDIVYSSGDESVFELNPTDMTVPSGAHTVAIEGCNTGNPPTPKFKTYYARTLDSLIEKAGYTEVPENEIPQYDIYGGIQNAGFTGKATGFFHTEDHGLRTWIIDPLGNPYFAYGISTLNAGSSTNKQDYVLKKYGTTEAFWKEMTAALKGYHFNLSTGSTDMVIGSETPFGSIVPLKGVSSYMGTFGLSIPIGGSSGFKYNNVMNVFEPDFISYVKTQNRPTLEKYRDNPYVFGYTSDNELPNETNLLDKYLTADPTIPANGFSYAAAWTFLSARTGKLNPAISDVTNELREEFKALVYSRLLKTVRELIDEYDPNHMFLGTRANGYNKSSEGYLHAVGTYCDMVTVNMYDGIEPSVANMAKIRRYSGKPYLVTEFYSKAQDARDMNGQLMGNQQNAGWLVRTQTDRAVYFENYTLLLLESRYCAGWLWFCFQDNDQNLYYPSETDHSKILRVWEKGDQLEVVSYIDEEGNILPATGKEYRYYTGDNRADAYGSNKGIVNCQMEFYEPLMSSITRMSKNILHLIQYFDNLHP